MQLSHKETSDGGALTHLWPLVGQSFHYLWSSIERTSTVGLQQRAFLEMIGKAEVSQLQSQRKRKHKLDKLSNPLSGN